MSILDDVGFEFDESMSGYLGVGATDPTEGEALGRRKDTPMRFDVKIDIPDLAPFLNVSDHEAHLTGTVTFEPLGGTYDIQGGTFNLFSVDAELGIRTMVYAFRFTAKDAQTYYLHGHKKIYDDPGEVDVVEDMTSLFTVVYQGEDDKAPVYGAGMLYFHLVDAASLVGSMRVTGAKWPWVKVAAYAAFSSFAWGALRNTYLHNERPVFDTEYANLALTGKAQSDNGEQREFFLVSGAHDKDFPWGDTECFWDVLLLLDDGHGGWRRFCLTDRVLDGMELDIEGGQWRYEGLLYELTDAYYSSFSAMRGKVPGHLVAWDAKLRLDFNAKRFEAVPIPFPAMPKLLRRLLSEMSRAFEEVLPSEHLLGMSCAPHSVKVDTGHFELIPRGDGDGVALDVVPGSTFGDAEVATMKWFKEPKLLYGYICGLQPTKRQARIQIHTSTLRDDREQWLNDRVDALLGSAFTDIGSGEILIKDDQEMVTNLADEFAGRGDKDRLFTRVGEPLLEIRNDHFGGDRVFIRRIVRVRDPDGTQCLALEEAMQLLNTEPIGSKREVTVAAIRNEDKSVALDAVLEKSGFVDTLEAAWLAEHKTTGKDKADFVIAIKPNFMFSYNVNDRSSYTDPALFAQLVDRIRALGFERVYLVEAHSTYGEFFDRRSVKEMADYLGYHPDGKYEIVDLTLDATDSMHFGPHLGDHPVAPLWRDADFRISFAKNKTHAYAYYTLTLKNLYGALPMANKFKEYHCARDIYYTTIEYMEKIPAHFGLVDASLSADGPFGVFADPRPAMTHTVIGGADLVAVDWVAASKMGVDPEISKFMKLAVKAFGKPRIRLVGDGEVYVPWLNVPMALTLLTHHGVDASYYFGNLFYMAAAQMDETRFNFKRNGVLIRLARKLTKPLRYAFFVRTGKDPNWLNRFFSWLFYKMGY